MKKIHLICNAHLDPVWLWQWKEGAAEAISTFRVAADFCEEYDGFVFNHNEALLYEWVEKYDPALFKRIQKLVDDGKWIIMGGWYLQPDCTMISGESFLSQIDLGRKYFKEKFNKVPKTAINFDPFGHTRGLVQLLKKTGYENYVFMRPQGIKNGDFIWVGYDGSEVTAHSLLMGYNSLKGDAEKKISQFIADGMGDEITTVTWGVGNHGGGPSKKDLEDINKLIEKHKNEIEIVHSDYDTYFSEISNKKLDKFDKALTHTMVGCYTSMSRIKAGNRRVENMLSVAEKMSVYAYLTRNADYPDKDISDIRRTLAFCQFHDVLPGSAIKPVENDSLRTLSYAEEKCDKIIAEKFFVLANGQKPAKDGEIPIMIYNPHPFEIESDFEVEFMLQNQNWTDGQFTIAHVYDESGNDVATQNEKPEATFNLDWLKKISFRGKIKPTSMTRFDARLEVIEMPSFEHDLSTDDLTVETNNAKFTISRKTGRILEYTKNSKRLLTDTGYLEVFADNEDPWGMTVSEFKNKCGEFTLLSDEDAQGFNGYRNEKATNVKIVENGDVRTKIQATFGYEHSYAVIEYTISRVTGDLDVNVILYMNDVLKMVKYVLNTDVKNGMPYGQTVFGTEKLLSDESEVCYQKWCGIKNSDGMGVAVINNSVYGGSFTNDTVKLSLLRTPLYSAHPIGSRQISPHNRFIKHIDMGEREISFKITDFYDVESKALAYNEKPVVLSYFPQKKEGRNESVITIDNGNVVMTGLKKEDDYLELHLFNSCDYPQSAHFVMHEAEIDTQIDFKPFELKFYSVKKGKLKELKQLYIENQE